MSHSDCGLTRLLTSLRATTCDARAPSLALPFVRIRSERKSSSTLGARLAWPRRAQTRKRALPRAQR
jgi:hypothetical protein